MAAASSTVASLVLADLQGIFGARLEAFVTYAPSVSPRPSLGLVRSLEMADLASCAARVKAWQHAGAATPVLLTRQEFARSLDVFPVEFGEIIASHETHFGDDPFAGMVVASGDLRRACEGQVRSLLLHVREDYMEAAGAPREVARVVVESAAEFRALLSLLSRLDGQPLDRQQLAAWAANRLHLDAKVVSDALHIAHDADRSGVDAGRLFPGYLGAIEHLSRHIDEWPDR